MGNIIFAGVGNTLAGDDGAGIFMVRELERILPSCDHVRFVELEGDLYQIWDLLPGTDAFIFLDAVTGEKPGLVMKGKTLPRAYTPSFHQSDLSAVVMSLEMLNGGDFPKWTLWGVSIDPPQELGEDLTPDVQEGSLRLVKELAELIQGDGLYVEGLTVKIPCTN
jgi:hydrogenase maturation protease